MSPPVPYTLTARATDNRSAVSMSSPVSIIVTAPNQHPAVALVGAASSAARCSGDDQPWLRTASDSDGTVVKVEFFDGVTLIGAASTAPYTFNWSNVAAGMYSPGCQGDRQWRSRCQFHRCRRHRSPEQSTDRRSDVA